LYIKWVRISIYASEADRDDLLECHPRIHIDDLIGGDNKYDVESSTETTESWDLLGDLSSSLKELLIDSIQTYTE